MDLMTLAAKLVLDDSSFKSGIKSAESAGERLAGFPFSVPLTKNEPGRGFPSPR